MATFKGTCLLMFAVSTAMNFSSCSDSFMKSGPRSKTTALVELTATVDAAGNVTAAFDPTSKSVQVLRLSSGPLAGSGAAFPPGSLAFPVSISVGAGETLASSDFGQQLGLSANPITLRSGEHRIAITAKFDGNASFQVFWTTEAEPVATEEKSVSNELRGSEREARTVRLYFTSDSPVTSIRIDPLSQKGEMLIDSIELTDDAAPVPKATPVKDSPLHS